MKIFKPWNAVFWDKITWFRVIHNFLNICTNEIVNLIVKFQEETDRNKLDWHAAFTHVIYPMKYRLYADVQMSPIIDKAMYIDITLELEKDGYSVTYED